MTPSKVVPYCILILQYQNKKCNRRQNGIRLHCCPRFGFSGELTCCRPCENGTGVCGPSSVRPGNYRMDNRGAWCAGVFAAAVSCISILWTAFVSYCSNCMRLFSSKTIKVFSLTLCGWGTIILDNLLFKFVLQHQENCKTPEKFTDNKNLINNVNYTLLCFDWGTGYKVKGKSTYFFFKTCPYNRKNHVHLSFCQRIPTNVLRFGQSAHCGQYCQVFWWRMPKGLDDILNCKKIWQRGIARG